MIHYLLFIISNHDDENKKKRNKMRFFHCDLLSVFCKKIIIFCCHEKKTLNILRHV